MNNNLFFFFTAKQDQCMQVLFLRTVAYSAKNSSHSKIRLSHCTDQSRLPFPDSENSRSQLHCGSRGDIVTMALCSFTSVAQEHVWH